MGGLLDITGTEEFFLILDTKPLSEYAVAGGHHQASCQAFSHQQLPGQMPAVPQQLTSQMTAASQQLVGQIPTVPQQLAGQMTAASQQSAAVPQQSSGISQMDIQKVGPLIFLF